MQDGCLSGGTWGLFNHVQVKDGEGIMQNPLETAGKI